MHLKSQLRSISWTGSRFSVRFPVFVQGGAIELIPPLLQSYVAEAAEGCQFCCKNETHIILQNYFVIVIYIS